MSKELNSKSKLKTLSILKVVTFCFLLSFLGANYGCNSSGTDEDKKINWLGHWPAIPFKSPADDSVGIDKEKKGIRVYVRGWLAEYNDEKSKDYVVKEFTFERTSSSPLEFVIKAFLRPSADTGHGPGGHIIPPPPPKP